MRAKILELKKLGRMPNESVSDAESIVEVIKQYDDLLAKIIQRLGLQRRFIIEREL